VRQGFQSALDDMQAEGIRVAPYINGRIYDQATQKWKADGAEKHAAKSLKTVQPLPPGKGPPESELRLYNEQYGSQAQFAVMCPHTDYWQQTIADVVDRLVNQYKTFLI